MALTLGAACGLSTGQIAVAFLIPEATLAQRLVRAKQALRDRPGDFDPPDPDRLGERLPAVLSVLYLVFNEGYLASDRVSPQRRDLAIQALMLARLLTALMPGEPEVAGLTSLLEQAEARAATRFDSWGRLILLQDQDRRQWDHALIAAAVSRLRGAVARGQPGRYQLEAGIAAQHALAPSFQATDWAAIRSLYDRATRAELLRACGQREEARRAWRRALELAVNPAERELLARRLGSALPG